jgi:hypothetical protein
LIPGKFETWIRDLHPAKALEFCSGKSVWIQ